MKFLKNIFYGLTYYSGITKLFYQLNRDKQIVVNYHHVIPQDQIDDNMVYSYSHSLEVFKKHLQIMKKRFEFTTEVGKPGTVLLTFDDGAINNYKYALPVLDQFNIKAYFFIIDSMINSNNDDLLWVDKWILWFTKVPYGSYEILDEVTEIQSEIGRLESHSYYWKRFSQDYSLCEKILYDLEKNYSFSNFKEYLADNSDRFAFLTNEQIEEMKASGHKIGYHGLNHDILNKIPIRQLEENLQQISRNRMYNCKAFAIPFGTENDFNEEVLLTLNRFQFYPVFLNYPRDHSNGLVGRINLPNDRNYYRSNYYLSGLYKAVRYSN